MNKAGILRRDNLTNKVFGQRMKVVRKKMAKLSQRGFAQLLGFSTHAQIGKYENGTNEPTLATLRTLVKLYQIDLHELIVGEPSKAIEKELKLLRSLVEDIKKQLAFTRGSLRVLAKAEAVLEATETNVESILKTFGTMENREAQQGKL